MDHRRERTLQGNALDLYKITCDKFFGIFVRFHIQHVNTTAGVLDHSAIPVAGSNHSFDSDRIVRFGLLRFKAMNFLGCGQQRQGVFTLRGITASPNSTGYIEVTLTPSQLANHLYLITKSAVEWLC